MSSTTNVATTNDNTAVVNEKDEDTTLSFKDTIYSVFNQSNILILILFLAIYLIIYIILGIFKTPSSEGSGLLSSRMFDIIVFGVIGFVLIYKLFYETSQEKESEFTSFLNGYKDYVSNKNSVFSISILAFFFYVGIYFTGISMDASKPLSISLFESGIWITFIICLIVLFFKSILDISIVNIFDRIVSGAWDVLPEKSDTEDNEKGKKGKKTTSTPKEPEVFHISNNLYTYDDAKTICASYGGRLATYDDIEKAYNRGAEWCGYGWSANQMALFPTQKESWNKLQSSNKHKNDCGRPGINGGYMANPNLRFGVNCFGIKPEPRQVEKDIMNAKKDQIIPRSRRDVILDKKVQYWKDNGDKILQISSFNSDKWSEY